MSTETTEAAAPEAPETPEAEAPEASEEPRATFNGVDVEKYFEADETEADEAPAPIAAKEEPKEPPKPEAPKEPPQISKAFAELSKREARIRAREQEVESKFRERETELAEKQAAIQGLLDDPLAALEKLGVTYETLTEQVLNNRKAPADLKQRAEIQKLKEAVAAREKADAEREAKSKADAAKAEAAASLEAFKVGMLKTIAAGGEKYELITALGKEDLVFDVIDSHATQTGEILDVNEAARRVEEHLEAEETAKEVARYQRLLQTKKMGAKLAGVSPAPQRSSGGQSATSGQRPKTLTSSNAVATSSVSHTPLSDEERRAKALAILESGQP